MSTMNWKDPETKSKLLMAVLASQDEGALSGAKAAKIAEIMGCTAKAVSHQLVTLRKDVTELRTGEKPKASASPQKRKSNKSKDDDDSASPVKKRKPTPKKAAKSAKKVVDEDSDNGEADEDMKIADRKAKAENGEEESSSDAQEETD